MGSKTPDNLILPLPSLMHYTVDFDVDSAVTDFEKKCAERAELAKFCRSNERSNSTIARWRKEMADGKSFSNSTHLSFSDAIGKIVNILADISFSVSPRDNGSVDDHWIPSENIARARRAADAVPDRVVNVLLCVGGAGRSAGFAKATSTAKRRRRFVANLEALLEEHSLDGVDFDWEAPRNDEEMANYVLLLRAAA